MSEDVHNRMVSADGRGQEVNIVVCVASLFQNNNSTVKCTCLLKALCLCGLVSAWPPDVAGCMQV